MNGSRTITIAVVTGALAAASGAFAQQIPPMIDNAKAAACAPRDLSAALACLDENLRPEVKADILKAKNTDGLIGPQIYVGVWMERNWGLWTGSPFTQFMLSKKVTQATTISTRTIQAYWLKSKGCKYDFNEVGFVAAGARKADQGQDPCSVTVAEAAQAMAPVAAARRGRGAQAAAAAEGEEEQ